MSSPPGSQGSDFNNWHSQVGAQGGNVYGGVHFYTHVLHGERVVVSPNDPPEERFRAGLADLRSGKRGSAEELIRGAVRDGYVTTEAVYYLMLSVLSKRPFPHLETQDFDCIQWAEATLPEAADGYREGATLVVALLEANIQAQTRDGMPDPRTVADIQGRLGLLPKERSSEIHQHLGMLLHAVLKDGADAEDAEDVLANRRAGDRGRRAVKFFIPDPLAPIKRTAWPPRPAGPRSTAVGCCAVAALVGLVWSTVLVMAQSPGLGVLALLLLGAGGYGLVTTAPRRAWLRRRMAQKDFENGASNAMQIDRNGPAEVVQKRIRHWNAYYWAADARFKAQLRDHESATEWDRVRRGPQFALANDLFNRYGNFTIADPPDPALRLQQIGWLFQMHAAEVANRWRTGTLDAYRSQLRQPVGTQLTFHGGLAAAVVGMLLSIGVLIPTNFASLLLILPMVGLGAWLGWRAGYPVVAERMQYKADTAEFETQYSEEGEVFEQWRAYLSDRPGDAEMASWLDYDQRALRREAMKAYGLTSWDVVCDFFLMEPAEHCASARMRNGPPRYSAYRILQFILTETDVRYVQWRLDFLTGVEDPASYRRVFAYDKIVSASVTQVGVSLHENGRRKVVDLDTDGSLTAVNGSDQLIMSQALLLSLKDQQRIEMVIENYDRFLDLDFEDRAQLIRMATETSGATVAVRILEAVTGAGRAWFEEERKRLQRRLATFGGDRSPLSSPPQALGPATAADGPGQ